MVAGNQKITADGVVGVSGKPIKIYSFNVRSTAGGAAVVTLYNGTSTGGVELYVANVAAASTTLQVTFTEAGKFFPAGCFVDVDANTAYVDFDYEQTQS